MVTLKAFELEEKELVNMYVDANNLPSFALDILRNTEDCREFHENFYDSETEGSDDLMKYKQYRIENHFMTQFEFIRLFHEKGTLESFENAFLQSFSHDDVEHINGYLNAGKITLEEVYSKFNKNPHRNILRYFKF